MRGGGVLNPPAPKGVVPSPSPRRPCAGPRCSGRSAPWPAGRRGTAAGWPPAPGPRWTACTSPAPPAGSGPGPAPPGRRRGPRCPGPRSGGRRASPPGNRGAPRCTTPTGSVWRRRRRRDVRTRGWRRETHGGTGPMGSGDTLYFTAEWRRTGCEGYHEPVGEAEKRQTGHQTQLSLHEPAVCLMQHISDC